VPVEKNKQESKNQENIDENPGGYVRQLQEIVEFF